MIRLGPEVVVRWLDELDAAAYAIRLASCSALRARVPARAARLLTVTCVLLGPSTVGI